MDWLCYLVDLGNSLPGRYARIATRLKKRSGYRLVEFTTNRQIKPFIEPLFVLANQAHRHLFEFSPLSATQIRKAAASYLKILDPRFVKMVTLNELLVGFSIDLPDLTSGIRSARGRLFPFGMLRIQSARRRSNRLDMLTGAGALTFSWPRPFLPAREKQASGTPTAG